MAYASNQVDELEPIIVAKDAASQAIIKSDSQQVAHTVNTVDSKLITRFQPDKLEEVLVYLPNVQAERLGAGIGEDYFLRGFSLGGRLLLDGALDNQNYYVRDPATIERIEVLKGQDSVLYGTGAPGGSVNFISKKPLSEKNTTLTIGLGSNQHKRLTVDSTGNLNSDKTLNYRSIVVLQDSDTWKANVDDRQFTLMNTIEWAYQGNSRLLATWELSQQHYPYDFDNVYANGAPVYDVSYVHPETKATRTFNRFSINWQHFLTNQAWLETQVHGILGNRKEDQIGFFWLEADDEPLVGYYREVDETFDQLSLRSAWHQNYQIDSVHNEWIVGLERNHTFTKYHNLRTYGTFGLDIYNPTFDFALPSKDELSIRDGHYEWNDRSLFMQNITQLTPQVEFRMGARYTDYDLLSERNDTILDQVQQSNLSKSFGLSWAPMISLELYASYSESFLPNTGVDRNENYFDAIEGLQKEIGLNIQASPSLRVNLAAFDIKQSNLLTKDLTDPDYKILAGEKRVTGIELQTQWLAYDNIQLTLNAGLLNPRLSKNNDGYEGNLFPSIPSETAALILQYQPKKSLDLMLGAVYQGKRAGNLQNSFYVDSYIRYDAALNWNVTPKISTNISVQNLTDINYVNYATAVDFVRFGNPRTWRLNLVIDW
jgi:TonB-dependent siderophore receptor